MVGVPKFWDEEAWMFKNSTCEPSVMVSSLLAIGLLVGVINRIEITNGFLGHQIADVWVRPGFYRLTYDQKLALAKMIYQYHFADESPSLMFTDTMSGKIIGTFTPGLGLSMD